MVQLLPSFLSPQLKVLTTCEWENELRHSSSGQTLTFLKKKKKERKKTTKVAKRKSLRCDDFGQVNLSL